MWDRFVTELSMATHTILDDVAQFLPRLLAILVIVLIGWFVAYLLKVIVRSTLRLAKVDQLSRDAGAAELLKRAALPSSSELLSRLTFWVAWIGIILIGLSVLNIVGIQEHVMRFFGFLPRLVATLFIFFFGLLAASFFSRAALLAAVNADLPSPRLISSTIRALIILFTVSMGLEELGLAEKSVVAAFAIVFGAVMFGLALAFGLGGKDLAKEFLERRFGHGKPAREEEHEDELSPL
jgi:Mechanosensitive ion channel, conserved TM helix